MFNIGDSVRVVNSDGEYSITVDGSYGIVKEISVSYIRVAFEYTPIGILNTYPIDKRHLELIKTITKEEMVCLKVAAMYNRQKERGIVHV